MRLKLIQIALAISVLLVGYYFFQIQTNAKVPNDALKVVFCDVGQGDATYIRTPEGQDILIDGGPDDSVLTCLGKNMPLGDRELDLVSFSHDDADHITGMVEVMRRYKVLQVVWSGITKDTTVFEALKKEIDKVHSQISSQVANGKLVFGKEKRVELNFLYPSTQAIPDSADPNDYSLIEKLAYGKDSVLFTGDIMPKGIDQLTALGLDLNSSILKVPHHGSKNGLNQKLLDAVKPDYATISVGVDNKYGHPHQEIIDMLMSNRIKIYRTDKDGQITAYSEGKGFSFAVEGKN